MLIQSLPASSGATWLRDGWRLFRQQPLGLSAMVVAYLMILFVPALIPLIGLAISGTLAPFATLGLLAACREVEARRAPTVQVFLRPFQDARTRTPMLQLGLINAALLLTIAALSTFFSTPAPATPPASLNDLPINDILVQLVLYMPVLVLMWFAPVLVGWHALTPGKAMFGSVVACGRNMTALLVFSLVVGAVMLAVSFLAVSVLSAFVTSREAMSVLLAPVALLLMTVVQVSFYPMYRAVFSETP